MVEFGDERDKKEILEMHPWSYNKQLIILQEFEGKQTLMAYLDGGRKEGEWRGVE